MLQNSFVPVSLIKEISDKNFYPDTRYATIDVDAMLEAFPSLTHLKCLGVQKRSVGYELAFIHPGPGMWLRLGVTKSQLKKVQSIFGL